jgi:CheY-like chemotaxis protein
MNIRARELGLLQCGVLFTATEVRSGRRDRQAKAQLFISVLTNKYKRCSMKDNKKILLVEDNPDDIELTLRAFRKNKIMNEIIIKRDGAEALDFFFGEDGVAVNNYNDLPILTMLDLKLPKIDGLDVLKKIRSDKRTKLIPVVILTSSNEQSDLLSGYELGCNSYIRKPVDFNQFTDTVKQLGFYWLLINEIPLF